MMLIIMMTVSVSSVLDLIALFNLYWREKKIQIILIHSVNKARIECTGGNQSTRK